MRKLFVTYYTGYAGMDGYEVVEFHDDTSDEDIDEELYYLAVQYAQSYGIEVCSNGEYCEDDECQLDHEASIHASWEEYIPEKHDMYFAGS